MKPHSTQHTGIKKLITGHLHHEGWFENPHHTIWLAVIGQAVIDLRSNSTKRENIEDKARAHQWVFAKGGNIQKDFYAVCKLADIEPSEVRILIENHVINWWQK